MSSTPVKARANHVRFDSDELTTHLRWMVGRSRLSRFRPYQQAEIFPTVSRLHQPGIANLDRFFAHDFTSQRFVKSTGWILRQHPDEHGVIFGLRKSPGDRQAQLPADSPALKMFQKVN